MCGMIARSGSRRRPFAQLDCRKADSANPVLKTAMGRESHRGFESHTLRIVMSQDIGMTPNLHRVRGRFGFGPGGCPVGW
ncbi:MAG: hypothetical protein JWL68_3976 [Actinomycetia bacterium]|nr:hypothetical protein [Actinomycetes bacterium]